MILIADGGSTKTDWHIIDNDVLHQFHSKGINPFFNTEEQIREEIFASEISNVRTKVKEMHFYGAGMVDDKIKAEAKLIFEGIFTNAEAVTVNDDMLAAARALLGNNSGIACILGTGSNSCLYSGNEIGEKVPALGYILGDEGSGTHLGKAFLNKYFKRGFTDALYAELHAELDLNMSEVITNTYKKQQPNRYLASFTKVIKKYIHKPEIEDLVKQSLNAFIDINLSKYPAYNNQEICFVGSIAYYFKDQLFKVFDERGLKLGKILQSPMEGLVEYHKINK